DTRRPRAQPGHRHPGGPSSHLAEANSSALLGPRAAARTGEAPPHESCRCRGYLGRPELEPGHSALPAGLVTGHARASPADSVGGLCDAHSSPNGAEHASHNPAAGIGPRASASREALSWRLLGHVCRTAVAPSGVIQPRAAAEGATSLAVAWQVRV